MARPPLMDDPARLDMRLPKALLMRLDSWRGAQPDVPGRAEAARRILEKVLEERADHATA